MMTQSEVSQIQIDGFLETLRAEGRREGELAGYRRVTAELCKIARRRGSRLDKRVLAEWRSQQDMNAAPGTVTNRVVKANHFLRYLGREDLCFAIGGRLDLSGMKFGSLVAVEPTDQRSADRSICWKCRCVNCGQEKVIPANQLKKGVHTSCGCIRETRLQKTNGYIDGTSLKNVLSDKISSNNTSGHKGVFRKRDKWAARIQYKKKIYYLGAYDRFEDAVAARQTAEKRIKDDAADLLEKIAGSDGPKRQKGYL